MKKQTSHTVFATPKNAPHHDTSAQLVSDMKAFGEEQKRS
jgi:hypothetical protein